MVQVASKGIEIGDILAHQLQMGEPFDQFTFRRLISEIEQLPTYEEQYHCLGRLYGVQQDVDKAVEYFDKTLRLNSDAIVRLNYYVALTYCAKHKMAYNVLLSSAKECCDLQVIEEALCRTILNLNIDDFEFCMNKLAKAVPQSETYSERVCHSMIEANALQEFVDKGLVSKADLKNISDIVWSLLEDKGYSNVDCIAHHGVERAYLSIDVRVFEPQVSAEDMFDLNMALIDGLVEQSLDDIPVVVQFVRSSLSRRKSASQTDAEEVTN